MRVAIVERELVAGERSYWACMPTKTLLRPGEALVAARRVPRAREAVAGELDVTVALAIPRLITAGCLEVEGRRFATERIVFATGSSPGGWGLTPTFCEIYAHALDDLCGPAGQCFTAAQSSAPVR